MMHNLIHDLHTLNLILTTVNCRQDVMDLLLVTQYFDMLKEVGLNGKQQNTVIFICKLYQQHDPCPFNIPYYKATHSIFHITTFN